MGLLAFPYFSCVFVGRRRLGWNQNAATSFVRKITKSSVSLYVSICFFVVVFLFCSLKNKVFAFPLHVEGQFARLNKCDGLKIGNAAAAREAVKHLSLQISTQIHLISSTEMWTGSWLMTGRWRRQGSSGLTTRNGSWCLQRTSWLDFSPFQTLSLSVFCSTSKSTEEEALDEKR